MILEMAEAEQRLHQMWDALLANETVRVEDRGRLVCNVVPQIEDEDERQAVIEELMETIGYRSVS